MLPCHARRSLAILFLLLAGAAMAAPRGPAEREGRRGLVFGVDGDRLLAFDGAMVAVRQQIGERTGLRLGLAFSLGSDNDEVSSDQWYTRDDPDTSITQTGSSERSSDDDLIDLDLDLLLIRHDRGQHAVRFCYGVGPVVGYRRDKSTELVIDESESERRTNSRLQSFTAWSYGLRVLVGAEWFLTESISVHAEYRAGAIYQTSELTRTSVQLTEPADDQLPTLRTGDTSTAESDGWSLASHGARVGVSLFF